MDKPDMDARENARSFEKIVPRTNREPTKAILARQNCVFTQWLNRHGKNHSEAKGVGHGHLLDQELSLAAKSRSRPVGPGHYTKFLKEGRKGVSMPVIAGDNGRKK